MSHHVMRCILASAIMVLFAMEAYQATSRTGAGGLFAVTVLQCCYWFLSLVGGIYFSTAIVEEKEEQTLPLLRMTGASTLAIISGKSLPRLVVAVLFLLVVAPFLLLSVTLGGVLTDGLVAAVLGILCYSVFLSQIGLFSSVVCQTAPRAFTFTLLLWGLFEFSHLLCVLVAAAAKGMADVPYGVDEFAYFHETGVTSENWLTMMLLGVFVHGSSLSEWLASRNLMFNLNSYLTSFSVAEWWRPQMTFHLILSGCFFCFSWVCFEPFTRASVGGGILAGPTRRKSKRRSGTRVWNNALVWKSWHYLTGRWTWLVIRLVGLPILVMGIVTAFAWGFDMGLNDQDYALNLTIWGIVLFLITLASLFGRVFNQEIHGNTLTSLLMLPQRRPILLWSLVAGLLPALAATSVCALLGLGWLAATQHDFWSDLFDLMIEPWFYQMFTWVLVTIHLGVLLSVYVRYGGMLLSVALLWFGCPMLFGACMGMMAMSMRGGPGRAMEDFMEYVVPVCLMFFEVILCVVIQFQICRRIEALGGK